MSKFIYFSSWEDICSLSISGLQSKRQVNIAVVYILEGSMKQISVSIGLSFFLIQKRDFLEADKLIERSLPPDDFQHLQVLFLFLRNSTDIRNTIVIKVSIDADLNAPVKTNQ